MSSLDSALVETLDHTTRTSDGTVLYQDSPVTGERYYNAAFKPGWADRFAENPDLGDDYRLSLAGYPVQMAAQASAAANLERIFKMPFWLDANEARGRISANFSLSGTSLWTDGGKESEKICGLIDVVVRNSRSLFAHHPGLIVKVLTRHGKWRLVAIPESWTTGRS